MTALRFLTIDVSDNDEGVVTIEALASTSIAQHDAALAEAQRILDWAWQAFPHVHGAADEGGQWDHDLQVNVEPGGWHSIALTLTGTPAFAREFAQAFPATDD